MTKISNSLATCLALVGLAASEPASAAVWCPGTVYEVILEPGGGMGAVFTDATNAQWGGWMCNVTGTVNVDLGLGSTQPMTSDTCRAIYSTLLTARASNKTVKALYYGSVTSCTAIPAGQIPGEIHL